MTDAGCVVADEDVEAADPFDDASDEPADEASDGPRDDGVERPDGDGDADGAEAVDTSHLDDMADGCGCAEVWEHLSERREESSGASRDEPNDEPRHE